MKGKKLQTEERHKGLQHQCNSRGQQRGAQPGTNHRCVLQQPLQRERGLTCHGTLRSGAGEREHALRDAGTKQQSPPEREAKPSASPPTGTWHPGQARAAETGTHGREKGANVPRQGGEPARTRLQLQALLGMRGAPSLRRRGVCTGSEGCPTLGSASPSRCPLARPQRSPGVCRVPAAVGTGAQSPAPGGQGRRGIAHCCCGRGQRRALCLEQHLETCQIWVPSGRFAGFWGFLSFFFPFCWPSS